MRENEDRITFIGIVTIVIIVALTALFAMKQSANSLGMAASACADTDGGRVYELKGTVTDRRGRTGTDSCQSSTRLREYYCKGNGDRANEDVNCPSGQNCVSGACQSNSQPGLACDQVGNNAFFGCYYVGTGFNTLTVTRMDPVINFLWGDGLVGPLSVYDSASVRWLGNFNFPTTGNYVFTITTDDGWRLYIDDVLAGQNWVAKYPTPDTLTKSLSAGVHKVTLEYFEQGGGATAVLSWTLSGSTASCTDGVKNGQETDVDCGASCPKCVNGKLCSSNADCQSSNCVSGICQAPVVQPTCTDGIKNGAETDVDCGGSCSNKCANGKLCSVGNDCQSANCVSGVCQASTALACNQIGSNAFFGCYYTGINFDVLKLTRTDANINFVWGDTGTPAPGVIPIDLFSVKWNGNFVFEAGTYEFTTATDDGNRLYIDDQLVSDRWFDQAAPVFKVQRVMTAGVHKVTFNYYEKSWGAVAKLSWVKLGSSSSCTDSIKNGAETDIDCGDGCPKCANGKLCSVASDCVSNICSGGTCAASGPVTLDPACKPIKWDTQSLANHVNIVFVPSKFEGNMVDFEAKARWIWSIFNQYVPFQSSLSKLNAFFVTQESGSINCNYGCNGIQRLICCSTDVARSLSSKCTTGARQTVIIHNDYEYGGAGYGLADVAVTSVNGDAPKVAVHELGHSFVGLGDEYDGGIPSNIPNCDNSACSRWDEMFNQGWNVGCIGGQGSGSCDEWPGCKYCSGGNYYIGEESLMLRLDRGFEEVNERVACCAYKKETANYPPFCTKFLALSPTLDQYCTTASPAPPSGPPEESVDNPVEYEFAKDATTGDWKFVGKTQRNPGKYKKAHVKGEGTGDISLDINKEDGTARSLAFDSQEDVEAPGPVESKKMDGYTKVERKTIKVIVDEHPAKGGKAKKIKVKGKEVVNQ